MPVSLQHSTIWISPKEGEKRWFLIDASGIPLGRLCSQIAVLLRGKHKKEFAPHWDMGDYVIVINAKKVVLSGKKWDQKTYWRYSGYPSGMKFFTAREVLQKDPARLIREGVWGMLPKNRLGRKLLKKLKVYPGGEHPHHAQKPVPFVIPSRTVS